MSTFVNYGVKAQPVIPNKEDIAGLWIDGEDIIGESIGPVQPGRGYTGACTVAITGLLTTDTILADSTDQPTCAANGTLTIAAAAVVFGVSISRGGVQIGYYPCAEGAGTVCYNTLGTLPNGTISADTVHTSIYDGTGHDLNIRGFSDFDSMVPPGDFDAYRGRDGYLLQLNPVSTFDDGGWLDSVGAEIAPVETHAENGSKTLPIPGIGYSTFKTAIKTKTIRIDPGDRIVIRGWIDGLTNTNFQIRIRLGNTAMTVTTSCFLTLAQMVGKNEAINGRAWGEKTIGATDFATAGGFVWGTSAVLKVEVSLKADEGCTFFADIIAINPKARPKIIFRFDDGFASDYSEAYAYLASKNMVGTSFINSSTITGAGKLSLAQMQEMVADGWEFGNHTYDHTDLSLADEATHVSQINHTKSWLETNGFTEFAGHVAYPGGLYGATTLSVMASLGLPSGHTVSQRNEDTATGASNQYTYPLGISVESATTVAAITAKIDSAIATGKTCIILMHELVEAGAAGYQYLISNFKLVVDHAAAKSASGLADNVGLCSWHNSRALPDDSLIDALGNSLQYPGPLKLSLIESAPGVFEWPSAPRILLRTGVNNAVYNLDGSAKTFASQALALAAMATVADDEYLFAGTKEAVLYLTSQLANAARIKRIVGDAT